MYFFHQISNPLHIFHRILGLSRPDYRSLDEKGKKMATWSQPWLEHGFGQKEDTHCPPQAEGFGGEDEKDIFGWQEMVRDSLTHYSVALWIKPSHGAKPKEFTFQLFVLTKAK